MLEKFISSRILAELPYSPNAEQEELLGKLSHFLTSRENQRLFLLRGYAGTGKTIFIAALVRTLHGLQQKPVLMAPTGRAAKVLATYSGYPAYTIHKRIYRQNNLGEERFSIAFNNLRDTIFIVDEASMISAQNENTGFGTGNLLDDLIQFVYTGENCALILIGDDAQLPPVGSELSPALNLEYLKSYGMNVTFHQLTMVARQTLESGILNYATQLREALATNQPFDPASINNRFADVRKITSGELIDEIERAYREVGEEDTIVVTKSNKRMNLYNKGIRARVLWKEEEVCAGDRVMVTKNNYFWAQQYEGLDFLANGDMFEIRRIRNYRELYGYRFADASLIALDYDWEIDVIVWLDTFFSESPEQNYQMQQQLFSRIAEDYPEIRSKKELVKKIMESEYYNALQCKHAYAVTCHKAQGGQWKRVFIDAGALTQEKILCTPDALRWFYTALTRAREQVYLLNWQ